MSILDDALFDARKISEVQRGEVISTTGERLNVERPSILTSVYRTIYHDSRDRSLKRIDKCIKLLVGFSDLMFESKYLDVFCGNHNEVSTEALEKYNYRTRVLGEISEVLVSMIGGMNNFASTYPEDADVSSRMEKCIKKVLAQATKIQSFLSDLQKGRDKFESAD